MNALDVFRKNVEEMINFYKNDHGIKMKELSEQAGLPSRWLYDATRKLKYSAGGTTIDTIEKFSLVLNCTIPELFSKKTEGNKK